MPSSEGGRHGSHVKPMIQDTDTALCRNGTGAWHPPAEVAQTLSSSDHLAIADGVNFLSGDGWRQHQRPLLSPCGSCMAFSLFQRCPRKASSLPISPHQALSAGSWYPGRPRICNHASALAISDYALLVIPTFMTTFKST